jgi:hypothetical protein
MFCKTTQIATLWIQAISGGYVVSVIAFTKPLGLRDPCSSVALMHISERRYVF